jgi:hypothetical protein
MHLLLEVMNGFCYIKDCEDNFPIATINPRNELKIFKNSNFAPGSLLASFFDSIFLKTFFT